HAAVGGAHCLRKADTSALNKEAQGDGCVDDLPRQIGNDKLTIEIPIAEEITAPLLFRRKARVPNGEAEDALEAIEAPAFGSVEQQPSIVEALPLGAVRARADAVDRHQKIRPLDVGAVRGGNGERRLIDIEVGEPRAVEPVLQGAFPTLTFLQTVKRWFRTR